MSFCLISISNLPFLQLIHIGKTQIFDAENFLEKHGALPFGMNRK